MNTLSEFQTERDLYNHYAAVKRRIWGAVEPQPIPPEVRIIFTKPYRPPHLGPAPEPIIEPAKNADPRRMRCVIRATCFVRQISVDDMASIHRHVWRVHARWLCWSVIKELTSKSYPDIGRCLPGRNFDHTTVMYGIRNMFRLIERCPRHGPELILDRAKIVAKALDWMGTAGPKAEVDLAEIGT